MTCLRCVRKRNIEMNVHSAANEFVKPVIISSVFQFVVDIWQGWTNCMPVTLRHVYLGYPFSIHRCQADRWVQSTVHTAFIHSLNNQRWKNYTSHVDVSILI